MTLGVRPMEVSAWVSAWAVAVCAWWLALSTVLAQSHLPPSKSVTRDEGRASAQRQAAAAAYDRGSEAFRAGDYVRAAELYETAYRLAPAAPALLQAARAYLKAGDELRSASLTLALKEQYGPSSITDPALRKVLERAHSRNLRVQVVCEACEIEVDGRGVLHPMFFVTPGVTHRVAAKFDAQTGAGLDEKSIVGTAGEHRLVTLVAHTTQVPAVASDSTEALGGAPDVLSLDAEPYEKRASHGLPPYVTWIGVGATAVVAGVAAWSAIQWHDAKRDYETNPTPEGYEEGESLKTRTNWLIGSAAVLGVATLGVALFATDWRGGSAQPSKQTVKQTAESTPTSVRDATDAKDAGRAAPPTRVRGDVYAVPGGVVGAMQVSF
jgi:tetratricopeptide (TPR) repeat protein